MDATLAREALELTRSAAALLRVLSEEGVESIDPSLAEAPTSEPTAPSGDTPGPATVHSGTPTVGTPRVDTPTVDTPTPDSPTAAPTTAHRVAVPPPSAAPVSETSPAARLLAVREELGDCQRCGLCEGRQNIVFGEGNPEATLMFIGEGPGEQEDISGRPFVGRAGELLTQMIEKGLGIPRSEVYICNIVKCRPPGNRTPLANEVSTCRPFLDGQIEAVLPRVIVSLGKPAASLLLGQEVAITRIRGTWQQYRGIPLMPTLHPAFILRQYTPENRRRVWEDLKAALARSQE